MRKDIFGHEKRGYDLIEIRAYWLYLCFYIHKHLYFEIKKLTEYVFDYLDDKYPNEPYKNYAFDITAIVNSIREPDKISLLSESERPLRDQIKTWLDHINIEPSQSCIAWISRAIMGISLIDFEDLRYDYVYFQVYTSGFVRYKNEVYAEPDQYSLELEYGSSIRTSAPKPLPQPPVLPEYRGFDRKKYEIECKDLIATYLDDCDVHLKSKSIWRKEIIKNELWRHLKWLVWAVVDGLTDAEIAFREADENNVPEGVEERTVFNALWSQQHGVARLIGFVKKS